MKLKYRFSFFSLSVNSPLMKSVWYDYSNRSVRGGAELISIGMPTVCWISRPPNRANLWSIKKLEQVDDISFREQSVVFTKEHLTRGICIKVDFIFKKCRTNFCFFLLVLNGELVGVLESTEVKYLLMIFLRIHIWFTPSLEWLVTQ